MIVSLKWLRRNRVQAHDVENHRVRLAVVSSKSLASGSMARGIEDKKIQRVEGRADDDDAVLLLQQAEAFFSEQRHLKAAKLLRSVPDQRLLTAKHRRILEMACAAEQVYQELSQPPPEDWSQQGETHGNRNTLIYYKVAAQTKRITFRIEIPIGASLLVPVLAVINEIDLYTTWMPSWTHPHLGMAETKCLGEFARGHKLVYQLFDIPFPFSAREFIIDAFAVDAIQDDPDDHHDEPSGMVLKLVGVGQGVTPEGIVVGATPRGVKRVDYDAGFLFRSCPLDHPCLQKACRSRQRKHNATGNNKSNDGDHEAEPIVLISALQRFDAHIAGIPMFLINFFTRVALGQQWETLVQVAEEVRDGRRPAHQQRIAQQRELYGWIEERARIMVSQSDQYGCRSRGSSNNNSISEMAVSTMA